MEDLERAIEEHLPLPPLCGDRCTCGTWAEVNKCARAPMRNLARAALRAIEEAGYAIVPKEPTEAMRGAFWSAMFNEPPDEIGPVLIGAGYDAMIAAAQKEPK